MKIMKNILEAIGNVPLVQLSRIPDRDSATVLVKCEFMNPAGSIKDRMAAHIIKRAEQDGVLKPGGTIVENTSGNTGLGLAMTAAVKGYNCVFTMPDKMSQEKVNMLKAFGAEVIITPTDVPGDSPEHYVNVAKQVAKETPGAFYVNQYHNQENIEAHYMSTGPEIWNDTSGNLDAFVAGTGTGGTLSGAGRYLKEQNSDVKIVGVDPIGSVHYHYFHTKTFPTPHVYKVEGIGEDILCDAMDFSVPDEMYQVSDQECFTTARRLVREEGLFCGGSSGGIVHIALQVAKDLGPGKTVVAVLPDSATRYITKHLSDAWMQDYGFLENTPDLGLVEDLLARLTREPVVGTGDETVQEFIDQMRQEKISQIPIIDTSGKPVSIVHEMDLFRSLQAGEISPETPVQEIAQPVMGLIYPKARIEELCKILENDQVAIVVDNNQICGVISNIDVVEFMANRKGNGYG